MTDFPGSCRNAREPVSPAGDRYLRPRNLWRKCQRASSDRYISSTAKALPNWSKGIGRSGSESSSWTVSIQDFINRSASFPEFTFADASKIEALIDIGMTISENDAEQAYDYRSNFVHGQILQGRNIGDQVKESYGPLETLLRLLVRRSIEDRNFANRFELETAIDAAYPI